MRAVSRPGVRVSKSAAKEKARSESVTDIFLYPKERILLTYFVSGNPLQKFNRWLKQGGDFLTGLTSQRFIIIKESVRPQPVKFWYIRPELI